MKLYWGDLHNHCGISYGYGSLDNALEAARGQLDFVSITGHASWYDMPERTEELEYLIDFHLEGFKKLADEWDKIVQTVKEANKPHEFVTFQGYEAHSSEYGDHHFLSLQDDLPLMSGFSPADIVAKLAPLDVIAVPHHVGYTPGYRGANWGNFDSRISPIVEVYSKHGCSMSDQSMYPYMHDMGPRDSRNTIHTAIKNGLQFGFVGSTDHHAGYPGSYGDGRLAVLAMEKTRESIWDAIISRRTYAVTGDKIECDFTVNGQVMGSEVDDIGSRRIALNIKACDTIDKVVIYKNAKPWKVTHGTELQPTTQSIGGAYKVRLEMGWGKNTNGFLWNGQATIRNGNLSHVETCFRGRSVLAPSPDLIDAPNLNELNNKLIQQTDERVQWSCTTFKNPTTLHPHTAGLILEIQGDPGTVLDIELNDIKLSVTIGQLLEGSRSIHRKKHNSEALLVHRAVPANEYILHQEWEDNHKESEHDAYHVEVRQVNNQCAWVSPIYMQ